MPATMPVPRRIPYQEALALIDRKCTEGKLAVLTGAGTSVEDPSCLPQARDFTRELANALGERRSLPKAEVDVLASIQLEDLVTRVGWGVEFLVDDIYGDGKGRSNEWHQLVANMVKGGKTKFVVTMNFDLLLETAAAEAGMSIPKDIEMFTDQFIVVRDDLHPDPQKPRIVHLHGVAHHVNPVVTQPDLVNPDERTSRFDELRGFVQSEGGTFLVLGYSASDKDLGEYLRGIHDSIRARALIVRRRLPEGKEHEAPCLALLDPAFCETDDYSQFRRDVANLLHLPTPTMTHTQRANEEWQRTVRLWVNSLTEEAVDHILFSVSSPTSMDYMRQYDILTLRVKEGFDLRFVGEGMVLSPTGTPPGVSRLSLTTVDRGFAQWWYFLKRLRCRGYLRDEVRVVTDEIDPDRGTCSSAERELADYIERYVADDRVSGWYLQYPGYRAFIEHLAELMARHDVLHTIVHGESAPTLPMLHP